MGKAIDYAVNLLSYSGCVQKTKHSTALPAVDRERVTFLPLPPPKALEGSARRPTLEKDTGKQLWHQLELGVQSKSLFPGVCGEMENRMTTTACLVDVCSSAAPSCLITVRGLRDKCLQVRCKATTTRETKTPDASPSDNAQAP